jgi:hypothetical protein
VPGPWSDTLDVVVLPQPDLIFTVLAAFDTICNGVNTTLEVNFTAGSSPYSFTYSDGTSTGNENNISANSYQFSPSTAPAWTAGAFTDYSYTITILTDVYGCTNSSISGPDVSVSKIPETGDQYYIETDYNP